MRKIVLDFDLTVLIPLILLSLVGVWRSVRTFLSSKADCKACTELLEMPLDTPEEREEVLERRRNGQQENWNSKDLIWVSAGSLVVFCGALFMPDSWKIYIAYLFWYFLSYVSVVAVVVAIIVAWDHAKKRDLIKFIICIWVMLMAAASAEHFYHQKINARHVTCPSCSSDDDDGSENN